MSGLRMHVSRPVIDNPWNDCMSQGEGVRVNQENWVTRRIHINIESYWDQSELSGGRSSEQVALSGLRMHVSRPVIDNPWNDCKQTTR